MTIAQLCKAIEDCYARGLSGLDDETVGHLIELGDKAKEIRAQAEQVRRLKYAAHIAVRMLDALANECTPKNGALASVFNRLSEEYAAGALLSAALADAPATGPSVSIAALTQIADGLKSEHGENAEYDRALAELVAEASGRPIADAALVGRALVSSLRIGQRVDLEGDRYADPNRDHSAFAYEFQVVAGIEQETPGCTRVDFENCESCGFPPDHVVRVDTEQPAARRLLDASTGHLSPSVRDYLDGCSRHVFRSEHGYVLPVYEGAAASWRDEEEQPQVAELVAFAEARGFDFVMLDSDGPTVDGLPYFGDDEPSDAETEECNRAQAENRDKLSQIDRDDEPAA